MRTQVGESNQEVRDSPKETFMRVGIALDQDGVEALDGQHRGLVGEVRLMYLQYQRAKLYLMNVNAREREHVGAQLYHIYANVLDHRIDGCDLAIHMLRPRSVAVLDEPRVTSVEREETQVASERQVLEQAVGAGGVQIVPKWVTVFLLVARSFEGKLLHVFDVFQLSGNFHQCLIEHDAPLTFGFLRLWDTALCILRLTAIDVDRVQVMLIEVFPPYVVQVIGIPGMIDETQVELSDVAMHRIADTWKNQRVDERL